MNSNPYHTDFEALGLSSQSPFVYLRPVAAPAAAIDQQLQTKRDRYKRKYEMRKAKAAAFRVNPQSAPLNDPQGAIKTAWIVGRPTGARSQ